MKEMVMLHLKRIQRKNQLRMKEKVMLHLKIYKQD